jgi:dTDP-4-dehydrorhamnose reductase
MNLLKSDEPFLKTLDNKSFLITGSSGMLGRAFKNQINTLLPLSKVYYLNKEELDVTKEENFRPFLSLNPDFVIHCAALVDADLCEVSPLLGEVAIIQGTINVVNFANKIGAKILFPQSFLIYDDTNDYVTESTQPNPLSVYGRLKLEAELYALKNARNIISVHMGGFFGGEIYDNNFVGLIVPHLSRLITQNIQILEVGDRVWQPTFTNDLASNCLLLLACGCNGIYCMASIGSTSFFDLTLEIIKLMGIENRIEINKVDFKRIAANDKAVRPSSVIIKNARLESESINRQRHWRDSLAEYLQGQYFKDLF